jgi:hypothetical protein
MLSARFRPSCRRSGRGKQHGADLLKLIDDIDLIAAVDMAEGVVAAGSPGGVERVEEQVVCRSFWPKTSGGVPVFLLHIEHDHRSGHCSRFGMTTPTPLPARVGASSRTCSVPPKRRTGPKCGPAESRILHQLCLAHLADMAQRASPWSFCCRNIEEMMPTRLTMKARAKPPRNGFQTIGAVRNAQSAPGTRAHGVWKRADALATAL